MKPLEFTPAEDFVITGDDIACSLGASKLLDCPHCGRWAFSIGTVNRDSGNTVYHVNCTGQDCMAQAFYCSKDPKEAREKVIQKWNRRVK